MSEVLEVGTTIILLIGLFCFAWIDYKTQALPVIPLLAFGLVGLLLNAFMETEWKFFSIFCVSQGMLVGVVLLLVSVLSEESIGKGDGLLFISTGMFLNLVENLTLLVGTMFLIGCFSLPYLLLKKRGKKDRVAMGPFLLAAYVVFLLL